MQLAAAKTENELARFKNDLEIRGKEIDSLFKKVQLNVSDPKKDLKFIGQNIRLHQRGDTRNTRAHS